MLSSACSTDKLRVTTHFHPQGFNRECAHNGFSVKDDGQCEAGKQMGRQWHRTEFQNKELKCRDMLIEAERARNMKLCEKNELTNPGVRIVSEDRGGWRTDPLDKNGLWQRLTKEQPVSSLYQTPLQDSEWFTLSPQEKYVFVHMEGKILSKKDF